jgi:hypothetical protein
MSDYQAAIDIAQIIAAIAALAAPLAAFIQSSLTKEQMRQTIRPWIAIDFEKGAVSAHGKINFHVKTTDKSRQSY